MHPIVAGDGGMGGYGGEVIVVVRGVGDGDDGAAVVLIGVWIRSGVVMEMVYGVVVVSDEGGWPKASPKMGDGAGK
ncbi:hypothetical protein Tco_0976591 [Tanacetum coccineum]|uniref:Uncharacterized protein n=1 Tax=Tanacetum coccineum TaxID=301880 RepID=A0ABQ5EHM4_9ASTR